MSMETKILTLLHKKTEIFLTFEDISEKMLFLTAEDLPDAVDQREALLNEISAIDAEIELILQGDDALHSVLEHRADPNILSPDMAELYQASLKVKSIINRILKNSDVIREHMENEQQNILSQMETLNKSGSVVAEQYHQSVSTGLSSSFNRNKGKII